MTLETIKSLLRPLYHSAADGLADIRFWFRRKWRKLRRRGTSFPIKGTLCILCVKRPAYARLAVRNVNSLHFLNPGYRIRIVADDACTPALRRMAARFDYRRMVEVVNRFGAENEPWQFQKVQCLMEASRSGWILMDADTIWHGEPETDPGKATMLVKAYDFGSKADERDFLSRNNMARALPWPHFVTAFVSLPPALYSDELARLAMEWTKKAFSDERLKRISEEIGVNLAVQTLVPREKITTLKQTDGPNDRYIMQSLYYGCVNDIKE
ncbi:MAG: hypothetical protein ABSG17_16500 [Spirochaetia bacterium]|jgi:hypothetical protein